jgi:cell division septal protein FtsQ
LSPRRSRRQGNAHPTKRNRRKRNWFRIILNCLILAVLAELVFIALTSPRLKIAHIDVRGVKSVPASYVRDSAHSAIGINLFLADTIAVRRKVMKNPVVRTVRVYRRPLNTLIVRVEEREPFAILQSGGKSYLMDSEGYVFSQARSLRKGVVTVDLLGSQLIHVGSKPCPKLISSSFDCLQRAINNNFTTEKISVDPSNNMCLNIGSGLWVKLGQPMDLDGKFAVLKEVLARKPEIATQALYVDLRCITAPAWKAKGSSSTL